MKKILLCLLILICTVASYAQNKYYPAVSPDGSKLMYHSWINGASAIFLYDMKTNKNKLLTDTSSYNAMFPIWAPDGSDRIAFRANIDNPDDMDIYLSDLQLKKVTRLTDFTGDDTPIAFNHNLTKLYFSGYIDGSGDVYSMNIDKTDIDNLTGNTAKNYWGSFANGQDKIIFETDRDGNADIYSMNLNGSNQVNLTNNEADDNTPRLSPNGKYVAFRSDREGNSSVYIMDVDGSNLKRLTDDQGKEFFVCWSPDSKSIYFDSSLDGIAYEIYRMNTDGNGLEKITK